jgi:hypothetical protein
METPLNSSLKILFFAALLLPLFSSAAAVDNAALKYLLPDEVSTATITNFTSGGSTYYMVFQNNTESFVLKQDGQDYSIVSDRSALTNPAKDYLAFKYGAVVSTDKVAAIKAEYQTLSNLTNSCTKPMISLMLNPYQMQLVWDNGDYTGNTYRAVMRITGVNGTRGINITGISNVSEIENKSKLHKDLIRGYIGVVVGGMVYLGEMTANLSEGATTADNTAVMEKMQAFITEYKTPVTQYVTDHNFMNKFYAGVLPVKCNLSASSFANMDSLLVAKTLPSEAGLADNLSKSATERVSRQAASGDIATIVSEEQVEVTALGQDAAAARQTLAKYNISTDALDTRLSEVNAALERTKKSITKAEADSLHADFQTKLAAANELAGLFKDNSTIALLAAADSALSQSQEAIGLAAAKVGADDTNVNNLNFTWETARVEMETAKAQLSTGKNGSVEAMTAATTKLSQIRTTADGLSGVSGQTDILIVGFVVLLIIIGIVAFFYLKGQKKEPPVAIAPGPGTPGLKKGTSGIIVERK